jgi:hypothetical protein
MQTKGLGLILKPVFDLAKKRTTNDETQVDAILTEIAEGRRWAEVQFDEVRSLRLADDAALLTCRVAARWEHEDSKSSTLASSIYVKRDGVWKLAFHQQTPIEGG